MLLQDLFNSYINIDIIKIMLLSAVDENYYFCRSDDDDDEKEGVETKIGMTEIINTINLQEDLDLFEDIQHPCHTDNHEVYYSLSTLLTV